LSRNNFTINDCHGADFLLKTQRYSNELRIEN
jgi:hypothetical protein